MFITNPEILNNPYICGRKKAEYIMKYCGYSPFYFNKKDYYFAITKSDISLPWYIDILR